MLILIDEKLLFFLKNWRAGALPEVVQVAEVPHFRRRVSRFLRRRWRCRVLRSRNSLGRIRATVRRTGELPTAFRFSPIPSCHVQVYERIRALGNFEIVICELVHPKFYHLDTCFAPVDQTTALWYPPAFSENTKKEVNDFSSWPSLSFQADRLTREDLRSL